jgi:hypothetical protein
MQVSISTNKMQNRKNLLRKVFSVTVFRPNLLVLEWLPSMYS